jgi:cytochrome bd ubiquinol oxidase subunit I
VFTAAMVMPMQFLAGDLHGLNTLEHQPAKVAAMEGIWETERGAPLTLFGIPDEEAGTTHFAIKIPKLASLILTHELDGEIAGHQRVQRRAPAGGAGVLRVPDDGGRRHADAAGGRVRGVAPVAPAPRAHHPAEPLLWTLSAMAFSGWVATLAGWYVTEIGRQPFVVYGLLRTSEVATSVPPPFIGAHAGRLLLVYGLLLVTYVGVLKYMAENPVKHAPVPVTGAGLGKAGV